jgi:MoxR-like ATPase
MTNLIKEDWTLDELHEQAEDLRKRLNLFRTSLGRFFVEKQELIDLMVIAAVAQEPLLLIGPPGTAKSDLVLKFRDAIGIADENYFEYMLTRFTEPSEVVGPIDINQLREGRYVRREQGKLPTAHMAFLDEIFKSNSAILNILLTIINERKFYQDGQPVPVNLRILFAATNEIPEHGELSALKDRFVQRLIKTLVREDRIFVSDRKLVKLYRLLRIRAWLFHGGTVSRDDLRLLSYLGETQQEIELLRQKVPKLLGE